MALLLSSLDILIGRHDRPSAGVLRGEDSAGGHLWTATRNLFRAQDAVCTWPRCGPRWFEPSVQVGQVDHV